MNAIFLSSTYRQLTRALNFSSKHIYRSSPFYGQQAFLRTSSVHWYHPKISPIAENHNKVLRKRYDLSDDFSVIYKEPKLEINYMDYVKWFELFLYGIPLMIPAFAYYEDQSLATFISQDKFYVGMFIVGMYLLLIRFVTNAYVKVMFYDHVRDVYRAYVLNKYIPTYKFVEFKSQDLKGLLIPSELPFGVFKAGKQRFIFHHALFASYDVQVQLTAEAIEKMNANRKK